MSVFDYNHPQHPASCERDAYRPTLQHCQVFIISLPLIDLLRLILITCVTHPADGPSFFHFQYL